MPTVGVYADTIQKALNQTFTDEEFNDLCFSFGLELDEVTSEAEMVSKERGADAAKGLSERIIWKVDVPANRYDLLCVEGLQQALLQFLDKMPMPNYRLNPPTPVPEHKIIVKAKTAEIRPYVVGAILRDVTFDEDSYKSFIDLQDRLHQNICRKRTLASIGTHDLSTIKGPFTYEALDPKDINFVPLKETKSMNGHELMEHLSQHQQLKAYLPIIRSSPVYPVIYDANRVVCSLPPIINGEHSKITLHTKDVFIEVTATDLTKASIVLDTVVANFSLHCKNQFEIEPVTVEYESDYPANAFTKGGDAIVYPNLEPTIMKADSKRLRRNLNIEHLSVQDVSEYFCRMGLPCDVDKDDGDTLNVKVPITRSDVMHEVDMLEDLAIAYGYNNLEAQVPMLSTHPRVQPVNHLTDLLRNEFAAAGFNEALNWGLCSHKDNFEGLRREESPASLELVGANPYLYVPTAMPVSLGNPKTKEFEVVRTSLLPGLLKTLACNKHNSPPVRFFEVSDVVVQVNNNDTGAINQRRAAAVINGQTSHFETLHGLLDQIMYKLNLRSHFDQSLPKRETYRLIPSEDPAFFSGMQAHIQVKGINIGVIGVLHPDVVTVADMNLPTSALEFNVEPFLEWL